MSKDKPFIIGHDFKLSRAKMFTLWTQEKYLQNWFGPKGITIPKCSVDLRQGGTFHYCMRMPGGQEMWGKWVFRKIVLAKRLEWINSFSDANAGLTRHPLSAEWPLQMLSVAEFSDMPHQPGASTVTITWTPISATAAERKVFNNSHASMQQGWQGTLEQLEAYIEQLHQAIKA